MSQLQSTFGFLVLLGIAWLLSEKPKAFSARILLIGVGLQIALAATLLHIEVFQQALSYLNEIVRSLQNATEAGTSFIFGYLGGGPLPFEETQLGASFILAFRALPLVIVISALSALFTYWRILPWIVRGFALLLEKTMAVSGPAGLGTAANIFIGMVEAPLLVRSYLKNLTRAELFILMTAGMATIAGTVLVLYATFIASIIPNAVGHLLTASIISAPAAITVAHLMVPGTSNFNETSHDIVSTASSSIDALTTGTLDGLRLYLNIIAMLLVFVACVYLINSGLGFLSWGDEAVTLERLLGYLMAPITWLMGIPWNEAVKAGELMGIKTVLNELLAYIRLSELDAGVLSERSRLIMIYALCGFANFGSLGIMIGGLTTMVPEKRQEILALAPRTVVSGTLATCCTGAVVGILSST